VAEVSVARQTLAQEAVAAAPYDIRQDDCVRFLRGLADESVDLIVTDPAYSGMNQHMQFGHGRIVGHYRGHNGDGRWFAEFHDDPDSYRAFLGECHRVLRDGRHIYIMFDSFSLLSLGGVVREVFDVKNVLVWDKVNLGMGHYFRRRHEHVLFATKGRRRLSRRDLPDVWTIKRLARAPYPTQKPVALFERMLAGSAEPGFVVCDPFVGSGSAAIAALRSGCHFVGADIADRAVTMARARCAAYLAEGIDPLEPAADGGPPG
jgi:site-specific DNA-methyltransferase (adenine-specific)